MKHRCPHCGAKGARFKAGPTAYFCDRVCFIRWDEIAEAEEMLETFPR